MAVVAIPVVVPVVAITVEVEVVSVVAVALVLCSRPVVAVVAHVVDTRAVAVARRRHWHGTVI